MKLDSLDREILRVLQLNGRLGATAVARLVGISATQCLRRKHRLEEGGVIHHYRAVLDPWKIGLGLTAFVRVWLNDVDEQVVDGFIRDCSRNERVIECHLMNDGCDFLLRVVAPRRQTTCRVI
ncbi:MULTISPECIES: Lrp/AsnC family transcriptional regulator [Paraburkholderia]|uniref:Lrp/AsnC family transcriptional regulator n=1 Tax=Paraburkholderia TaxID=1822464 RepID=UPI00349E6A7B